MSEQPMQKIAQTSNRGRDAPVQVSRSAPGVGQAGREGGSGYDLDPRSYANYCDRNSLFEVLATRRLSHARRFERTEPAS